MLPRKEKRRKGLFAFFNKSKEKEKTDPKINQSTSDKETDEKDIRYKTILLIGSTGKGKSTLANVLVNKDDNFKEIFKESSNIVSGTKKVQREKFIKDGVHYMVIDTVGLGDTEMPQEEVLDEIAEAAYLVRNGVSRVFFIIDGGRFNEKEMANYDLLKSTIFDSKVVEYTTIVRTNFKNFEDLGECQKDINSMIEEGSNELVKIIESCQKRVVHVENPTLNLLPEDDEDPEEEQKRIAKEVERRKLVRVISRKKLIDHLEEFCCDDDYKPPKLQGLNEKIAEHMKNKIESREKLEEKWKRLGLKARKFAKEDEKISEKKPEKLITTEQISQIFEQKGWVDKDYFTDKEEWDKIKKRQAEELEQELINIKYTDIKSRITRLEEEIEEIKQMKVVNELRDKILEADRIIRGVVREHILSNSELSIDISAEVKNFVGKVDKSSVISLENLDEIKKQQEKAEEGLGALVTQTNLELLELKFWEAQCLRQIENDKELFKEWKQERFDSQSIQKYADFLGWGNFNPKTDIDFCIWLKDKKKIDLQEKHYDDIVARDELISELREEYEESDDYKSLQKWLEKKYPNPQDKEKLKKIVVGERDKFHSNLLLTEEKVKELNGGELDLSGYPNLKEIKIYGDYLKTPLTKLELGENPKLTKLVCSRNQLVNLNLINSPDLKELSCWNNLLTELKLDNLEKIVKLYCSDNELTKLILPEKPNNLKEFEYWNNRFSDEDLDKIGEIANLVESRWKLWDFAESVGQSIGNSFGKTLERFKGEVPEEWKELGFDYEEYREWKRNSLPISSLINKKIANYPAFAAWLKKAKKLTPKMILIRSKNELLQGVLQREYEEYLDQQKEQEQQFQIEISPK